MNGTGYNSTSVIIRTAPAISVPGPQSLFTGQTISFTGSNVVSVADPNLGSGSIEVIVSGNNNVLTGGLGADTFVLNRGDGTDWIDNFTPGVDHLSFGAGRSGTPVWPNLAAQRRNLVFKVLALLRVGPPSSARRKWSSSPAPHRSS